MHFISRWNTQLVHTDIHIQTRTQSYSQFNRADRSNKEMVYLRRYHAVLSRNQFQKGRMRSLHLQFTIPKWECVCVCVCVCDVMANLVEVKLN